MTSEERAGLTSELNRRWEDALRAAFPLAEPPLSPDMVPKWREQIDVVHEEAVLSKEIAAAISELEDLAVEARHAEDVVHRVQQKIRARAASAVRPRATA